MNMHTHHRDINAHTCTHMQVDISKRLGCFFWGAGGHTCEFITSLVRVCVYYMHVYIGICICMCIELCTWMCVNIYICICIYIYIFLNNVYKSNAGTQPKRQEVRCPGTKTYISIYTITYIGHTTNAETHQVAKGQMPQRKKKYIYICIYIYVHIYVYIYTHTY